MRGILSLHGTIFEYDLYRPDLRSPEALALPDGYSFRMARDLPKDLIVRFARKNRYEGYIEKVLEKNLANPANRGVCLMYGECEIAAIEWVFYSLKGVRHREGYPDTPASFYALDAFIARQHRGKGLHRMCFVKRFQVARDDGCLIGYGIVRAGNRKAMRTNDGIGRRIGWVLRVRPLGRLLNIYRPCRLGLYLRRHV